MVSLPFAKLCNNLFFQNYPHKTELLLRLFHQLPQEVYNFQLYYELM